MVGARRSRATPPSPEVRRALAPMLVDPAATAVMSDFDGTLSPIVDRPERARPLPGTGEVLARLAGQFAVVAVVSGRPASFLVEQLAVPIDPTGASTDPRGPRFVGLYGLEVATFDGRVTPDPGAARWRPVVEEVAGRLRSTAPPGVLVEPKGLAVTVHWRTAPGAEPWATAAVAAEADRSGLRPHGGRLSLELRPPLEVDKGSITSGLLRGCAAACYFGDDLGDLPAFAALAAATAEEGTVTRSVAVADDESPPQVLKAADLVVQGPGEALAALAWMADAVDDGAADPAGGG